MTETSETTDGTHITIHVPFTIKRRGGRKVVIAPEGETGISSPRCRAESGSTLIKAIARAYRWQRLVEDGTYATLSDLAVAEKISLSYISRLLQLTLLAPRLVEGVLDGDGIGIDSSRSAQPQLWEDQESEDASLMG